MSSGREVALTPHAPERRRWAGWLSSTTFCSCCCSCCCCAHSLGGLIGAAVASRKGTDSPERRRVNRTYWLSFLALAVLNCILPWAGEMGGVNIIIAILLLPGIQLAAALLACGIIALSAVEDKRAAWRHLGRIALTSFGGAFAGAVAMLALFWMSGGRL